MAASRVWDTWPMLYPTSQHSAWANNTPKRCYSIARRSSHMILYKMLLLPFVPRSR